jgi:hypothetical protein
MLGASVAMLVLVSALVAFGSWPGQNAGSQVDQVLLNDVVKPKAKTISVRADAVQVARRSAARRQLADARSGRTRTGARAPDGSPVAKTPSGSSPTTAAGTPVAANPGGTSPTNAVRQQTQNVTQNLDQTTRDAGTKVQTQVEQTQTQVNQVVDQVVGGVQPPAQQVQDTAGGATGTVQNTADSLLGH